MKSAKFAILFGALSLIFMGCPYESVTPVDSAMNAKGDESLEGKWMEKSDDSYKYKITMEGNSFKIVKKIIKGDEAPTTYKGFLSDVEGTTFANVWEVAAGDDGSSQIKYWIYKFERKGNDMFKLSGVTSNITEEFETSKEFKAFIIKYQNLSFFWDKGEDKTFLRE